jgi:hypothetical protein
MGSSSSGAYSTQVNNVWQGGKDNFAADRAAFRARAIRYLASEGIRHFLGLARVQARREQAAGVTAQRSRLAG